MSWAIITEAVLVGCALAMDAMAASVALAAAGRWTFNWSKMLLTAVFFGFFQFIMPLAGFLVGGVTGSLVSSYGKWVAGILLIGIGVKMFFDGQSEERKRFSIQQLVLLAFATSIDAFLVGLSYRYMEHKSIYLESMIIGVVTLALSLIGCQLGRWSRKVLGKHCSIPGALVLILLGLKAIFWN